MSCYTTEPASGFVSQANSWALEKDARLRIWPAGSSWLPAAGFTYPVRQRWFAGATQMANEPVFVNGDDLPGSEKIYYHCSTATGQSAFRRPFMPVTRPLSASSPRRGDVWSAVLSHDGGHETWDFGDASPLVTARSDENVNQLAADGYAQTVHRYRRPGCYLARVERRNDEGLSAAAHLQVRVGRKENC